jgi:hypothetical protein
VKGTFTLGRAIYNRTRSWLRFLFFIALFAYRLFHLLRANQWILRGQELNARQDLCIVFTGIEENKNYLADLAFGKSRQEERTGKKWIWQAITADRKCQVDCLRVTEVPRVLRSFLKKKYDFYVPCWINEEVDIENNTALSGGLKKIPHSLHSDMLRVQKSGLCFEITHEHSHFDDFYYNMYLPFIAKRHGGKAIYLGYTNIKDSFKKGALLLVKKGEVSIAGGVIGITKNTGTTHALGVKNGSLEYVRMGALVALYYYSFVYLQNKGCKKINLGDSRPFLKDGVLNYKKKWNIQIVGQTHTGLLLSFFPASKGIRSFLLNNPFVYADETGLNGAFFSDDDCVSCDSLSRLNNKYYINGMRELYIFRIREDNRMDRCNINLDILARDKAANN